ncbi:unnamed protein product [Heligmosomoides polygyrus]|uniref:Pkinase_fungal domain-containing protein n=1 Tax=Heligmosomoides polygyrus TaxID=6339 RepID=A0A183GX12_HELPZ|nr:unnamed protein product [Heligmosomoides polygyrus]
MSLRPYEGGRFEEIGSEEAHTIETFERHTGRTPYSEVRYCITALLVMMFLKGSEKIHVSCLPAFFFDISLFDLHKSLPFYSAPNALNLKSPQNRFSASCRRDLQGRGLKRMTEGGANHIERNLIPQLV